MKKAFDEIFEDITKLGTKVKTDEYHETGKNIIIDQGQEQIAGYTDLQEGLFTSVPALIFGDHTRIVKYVDKPFFLGADGVKVLRSRFDDANYRYLYYALKSLRIPDTGYNRHFKWLKEAIIKYPDNEKQEKIVSILDTLSYIIATRQKELKSLDNLIKARFVEMFGNVKNNDKKWKTKPLKELCDISRGGSPRPIINYLGGTIPWIKIGDATEYDNIYIKSTKEHIIEEGVKKSRYIKSGSLIFANCGVSLGFCRIITFDGCIHDGWLAFQNIDSSLDKVFLLMTINQLTEHFRSIAPGGTQPNLNTGIMGNYEQIIPPMELQKEFKDFVIQIDKSKLAVQKSLDIAQLLFDSLMQQYFG